LVSRPTALKKLTGGKQLNSLLFFPLPNIFFPLFYTIMNNQLPIYWPQFFTATIAGHKHLLKLDTQKLVIVKCLQFLVNGNKIKMHGYSIMSNHVHFIWQPLNKFNLNDIQSMFMKYTARQLLRTLDNHPFLSKGDFKVHKIDRNYQVWKRESLGVELTTPLFFHQKLTYIHNNPVKAGLCDFAETYKYSSAKFYNEGVDEFKILSHYNG
jgi:putative transposase